MEKLLSRQEVLKISKLARLRLTEDEIELLQKDLNSILEYINKLQQLDTSNITPTSHVLDIINVFREDEVKNGLTEDEVFKNAPDYEHSHFKVPRVVE